MPAYQIFVIVFTLFLILVAILFGKHLVQNEISLGTWVTTTTQCENETNSCQDTGFQFQNTVCVPDPKTRRGCLSQTGDFQTYAPYIKSQPCQLQCRRSVWDIKVGNCLNNSQNITYTCVDHDPQGINACTVSGLVSLNGGQFQGTQVYQVGESVSWDIGCLSSI